MGLAASGLAPVALLGRDLQRDSQPSVYKLQVLLLSTTRLPCPAIHTLQKHVHDQKSPERQSSAVYQETLIHGQLVTNMDPQEILLVLPC